MSKIIELQKKADDLFFQKTGILDDQLDASIEQLDLENDAEYQHVNKEHMKIVMQKNQSFHQNAAMGGARSYKF